MKSQAPIPESALLRPVEAAIYIGVSDAQLRQSRHTGEIFAGISTPAFLKLGKSVFYRRSTLDAWVASLSEYTNTTSARRGISRLEKEHAHETI